ncbi:MAG TPA: thioesterase family protein [Kiritimatiellia bacterium]|nr:thioesterase family protein [Kiritimatiellia bacterium]
MARVKIDLPENWLFQTEIPIRVTDINYGNHMGNDAFLGILHEARMRWLAGYGWTELIFDPVGLIMIDVAVKFKTEAHYGDVLTVSLAAVDWTRLGFDLVYCATNARSQEVGRAQSGFVFFDYQKKKVCPVPEEFRTRFAP